MVFGNDKQFERAIEVAGLLIDLNADCETPYTQWHYFKGVALYHMATNLQDSVLDSKKRDRIHNIGINIERGRQQRRVDLAHEELKVERQEKWVNMLISLAIVMVLLAIIVAMQYVQVIRKRHHKMLVKATQMREEFFTNVTHEFRTPLTVILGLSQEIARKRTISYTVNVTAAVSSAGQKT